MLLNSLKWNSFIWALERVIETVFPSFSSWDSFVNALSQIPGAFVDFSNALAWPYLISNLALAWIIFAMSTKRSQTRVNTFREFAFPVSLYRHSSTRLDCRFAAIDLVLHLLLYVPILTGVGLLGTKMMSAILIDGLRWEPPHTLSPTGAIVAAVLFLVLHDFLNYWIHVMFHEVPLLWSFHQVHHSAEVLTPVTAFRVHPMEIIGFAVLQAPAVGLAAVFYQNLLGRERQVAMIFGVSILGFLLGLLGNHLRHSHIWFSFGPWLNRLVMCPAHHQIHHSVETQHWNKNFGVKLTIWDALFGTLYKPDRPEKLRVGLPDEVPQEYTTVRDLYLLPFSKAIRVLATLPERRAW